MAEDIKPTLLREYNGIWFGLDTSSWLAERTDHWSTLMNMGIWGVSKMEVPQDAWFIRANPIKMDDLGAPLFQETSIWTICSVIYLYLLLLRQSFRYSSWWPMVFFSMGLSQQSHGHESVALRNRKPLSIADDDDDDVDDDGDDVDDVESSSSSSSIITICISVNYCSYCCHQHQYEHYCCHNDYYYHHYDDLGVYASGPKNRARKTHVFANVILLGCERARKVRERVA